MNAWVWIVISGVCSGVAVFIWAWFFLPTKEPMTYDNVYAWINSWGPKKWVILSEIVNSASGGDKSIGLKPYRKNPRSAGKSHTRTIVEGYDFGKEIPGVRG
jgi:hypothetical protein